MPTGLYSRANQERKNGESKRKPDGYGAISERGTFENKVALY